MSHSGRPTEWYRTASSTPRSVSPSALARAALAGPCFSSAGPGVPEAQSCNVAGAASRRASCNQTARSHRLRSESGTPISSAQCAASAATRRTWSTRSGDISAHAGSVGRSPGEVRSPSGTTAGSAFGPERRAHNPVLPVHEDNARLEPGSFRFVERAIGNQDDQIPRQAQPSRGAVQLQHTRAAGSGYHVRVEACTVVDVDDLDLLELGQVSRVKQILVHRERAFVMQVRGRDGSAMNL